MTRLSPTSADSIPLSSGGASVRLPLGEAPKPEALLASAMGATIDRSHMRAPRIVTFASLLLALPLANATSVFFSDLGNPGSLYNCCAGPFPGIGGGPPPVGPYTKGYAFSPSLGGIVDQLELPFWGNPPASVSLTLNADSNGSPGVLLDSWNIVPSGVDWSTCCALETLIPHGPIALTAGVQYWLVAAPDPSQFTFAGFFLNNTGALGPIAESANGGPFTITQGETLAAFQVTGNPVPEGGTFTFAALALAAFARVFQKRQ